MAYSGNVALKANIKIGGATNHVSSLFPVKFANELIMVVGADVTHANPGSQSPSVAAIVCSVDKNVTHFDTFIRAQGHREEIIQDLENVMKEALANFAKSNVGKSPDRIMFFRDGVAGGQFAEVKTTEIAAIQNALKARKIESKLTFIVVQKRHHFRLFPGSQKDRSGNCMPGTVVDTQITHPSEFNFFLQSHSGIQGMSRPALYHVLHDESEFSSDDIQSLCFSLCFLSQRATRSIGMVFLD